VSLNVSVATMDFLVCATDRRLTIPPTGKIVTERSTKLTWFTCSDATGFVTYNGIGKDHLGRTPSEWLLELDSNTRFSTKPFLEAVDLIRLDSGFKIRQLPGNVDRRHTFVVCALYLSLPTIVLISNYESVHPPALNGGPMLEFSVSFLRANGNVGSGAPAPNACVVTGSTQFVDRKRYDAIRARARTGAPAAAIRQLCIGLIRDAANRTGRQGPIGTSVLWGILDLFTGNAETGLDVIGGSSIHETPNVITPMYQMKDVYMRAGDGDFLGSKGLTESNCPICGTPVPFGYGRCGVCYAKNK
jgi:hypothetical protein